MPANSDCRSPCMSARAAHRAMNQVELLYKVKLMGKDVQLVHALAVTPAELDMIAETGASISTSPGSELRIGYGFPLISRNIGQAHSARHLRSTPRR